MNKENLQKLKILHDKMAMTRPTGPDILMTADNLRLAEQIIESEENWMDRVKGEIAEGLEISKSRVDELINEKGQIKSRVDELIAEKVVIESQAISMPASDNKQEEGEE